MDQVFTVIFVIVGISGAVYGAICFFNQLNREIELKTDKQLLRLSKKLRLDCIHGQQEPSFTETNWRPPVLSGVIDQIPCKIYTRQRKYSESEGVGYETVIQLTLKNPTRVFFALYVRSLIAKIFHGFTPIEFNDENFKKYFLIRTTPGNKEQVEQILNKEVRKMLVMERKSFVLMSKLIVRETSMEIFLPDRFHARQYLQHIEKIIGVLILIAKQVQK
jgi:hypothetical protein